MTNAERERAIQVLEYYGEKLGCKAEFDLAIKAIRIVEVIEDGFKRDGNMMDSDDWEDIKALVKKEAGNEVSI